MKACVKSGAVRFRAKHLECGESSPLSAGGLSPSNVVRRTILERTVGSGGFSRRSTRRCSADQSATRTKRLPVAALQGAVVAFSGVFKQALRCKFRAAQRAARLAGLLALGALALAAAGCRTFNYTDEDLAQERKLLAERQGFKGTGFGGGFGGGFGRGFSPSVGNVNLGSINCPNAVGGVCHGK